MYIAVKPSTGTERQWHCMSLKAVVPAMCLHPQRVVRSHSAVTLPSTGETEWLAAVAAAFLELTLR